ncbi:MAG: DnaD domain protein [Clostridiaceae bacterium]|nr:DnaD domain protein [Clostridiaceae bacterium]
MDQILLCSNYIPETTSIHNTFIKDYMLHANGSYVKVYLYLAMCIQNRQENLSISSLADKMENTEKDILRALAYWEKTGVLRIQRNGADNSISGIELLNPDNPSAQKAAEKTAASEPEIITESDTTAVEQAVGAPLPNTEKTVTPKNTLKKPPADRQDKQASFSKKQSVSVTEEQTLRLSKDEDFQWLCLIVENYLKRLLQPAEVQLLSYLYDNLHFSKELLLYLYEYCCSLQKTNVKYVQAVALSWAEQGISTPEEAQRVSSNYSTAHTAISRALALGRPLAGIECQYVKRWNEEWHMDLSVILDACNRTMLAIGKGDFKYIEGILLKWHNQNVHTLQDVKHCDENYKKAKPAAANAKPKATGHFSGKQNQFQTFQQRDTTPEEIDELEKILLTR